MEKEIFAVSDVYEHAASIGKDIEQIVQEYGKEAIEDIMPKIVYVLEQLETLAERHQDDQEKLAGLMIEREKFMIHANRDKAIQQRQLEEKLAYMEGLVTKDKKDMEQKLKRLEHENDSLVEELEKHGDGESIKSSKEKNKSGKKKRQFFFWLMDAILSGKLSFYKALPGDIEVMVRMKTTIDDQRDTIRRHNHQLTSQRNEIDALQEQVTRLGDINERLRSDSSVLSNESRTSSESIHNEKADLNTSTASLLDELRMEDANYNEYEEEETMENSSFAVLTTSICLTSDETNDTPDKQDAPSERPPVKKDPDRPRYTLKEMQSLLEERNTYKIKMMALEEELELYKDGGPNFLKATQSAPANVNDPQKKNSGVRTL
ncbi:RILP-like protein 1 isoform X1 [Clytia hemisphaerica]|uniref:RILP-like protein 1 isoform X1 n=1 Tax=Clytia hemisphaerica TaxID=252671 RepID=UPI0034D5D996